MPSTICQSMPSKRPANSSVCGRASDNPYTMAVTATPSTSPTSVMTTNVA